MTISGVETQILVPNFPSFELAAVNISYILSHTYQIYAFKYLCVLLHCIFYFSYITIHTIHADLSSGWWMRTNSV